ncbi:GAF domain-containing protein [Bosea sp. LjRoot9]|uniref:GAF domain-containing protein n=1 Tax=Bosea sp. LjRoot9 TaxID=3342341 RepID=UPI003ED156C9
MHDDLAHLLSLLEQPGQPSPAFEALDRLTKRLVGHRLFTILSVEGDEVVRLYANLPDEEPVGGRKTMGPTPWGDLVIKQRQPFLGTDMAAIAWAFSNHETIKARGMGSVINAPVVYDGETIGTINILDREHHYRPEHIPLICRLAPTLIPAILRSRLR